MQNVRLNCDDSSSLEAYMPVNTFDVIERRKRITFFKLGKLWVFKQFFDNRALFDALLNYYNKDLFRFEFKSTGARNNALKLLVRKWLRLRPSGGTEELRGRSSLNQGMPRS